MSHRECHDTHDNCAVRAAAYCKRDTGISAGNAIAVENARVVVSDSHKLFSEVH